MDSIEGRYGWVDAAAQLNFRFCCSSLWFPTQMHCLRGAIAPQRTPRVPAPESPFSHHAFGLEGYGVSREASIGLTL